MQRRRVGSMKALALACGLALSWTACATVKAPTLRVQSLGGGKVGITGAGFKVGFQVRNPNPEPVLIERFEYELFLNGKRLGRGYHSESIPLEGFAEEKIESSFDLNLLSVPAGVKEVLEHDRVKARVKGKFYLRHEGASKTKGFSSEAEVRLRQ